MVEFSEILKKMNIEHHVSVPYHLEPQRDRSGELQYCTIENAGYGADKSASIRIENASPSLANCTFKNGYGYGMYLLGRFNPQRFDNNIFTGHTMACPWIIQV